MLESWALTDDHHHLVEAVRLGLSAMSEKMVFLAEHTADLA